MAASTADRLLEREHEIGRLAGACDRAAAGAGVALLIEGPPGIGKTSLLDRTAELATERGIEVLRARGGELEQVLGFGVARDLLARRVAAVASRQRGRFGDGAAALALPALGLAPGPATPADEAAINHGLTWVVADLADEGPLALVVDDLQWSDPASAAWLHHLCRRVGDMPVLLVLGARPAAEPEPVGLAALRELPELECLRPGPLGLASVAALVRTFYAPDAEHEFVAACHRAAGGNPFHTQTLLDAAAADELPATAQGARRLADLAPEAVRHAVAGALRRAGAPAAGLARACAVLGDGAQLRHAAALAGLDARTAGFAADRLAAHSLLTTEPDLRFAHPVLLAGVRQLLASGERHDLHRRAARLYEAEGDTPRAAAHLLEIPPAGDPALVTTLLAAAEVATAQGALATAAQLLERALAEPPSPAERPTVLAQLGRARMFAGDPAVDQLLEAAQLQPPEVAAHLLATAAWSAIWTDTGAFQRVAREIDRLPAEAGTGRLRAEGALAAMRFWGGLQTGPGAAELVARARDLSGGSPAERELIAATAFAGLVEAVVGADELAVLVRRAWRDPEETLAPALIFSGQVASMIGLAQEALPIVDRAAQLCRRRGNHAGLSGLLGTRGLLLARLGDLRAAEANARVIGDSTSHTRERQGLVGALTLYHVLWILALRGLIDEGRALAAEILPLRRETSVERAVLRCGLGMLAAEAGDVEEAARLLRTVDADLQQHGVRYTPWVPAHRVWAVEALIRVGALAEARALAEKEVRLAQSLGVPALVGDGLRALGLATPGAEGIGLLREAVPLLEQGAGADRVARALLDLGGALRRDGRPTDARAPLRRAMELAGACGADLLADRCFDELRAAGAKPRRRAATGVASLTPSEERIARLAAEGRTNREIAQALFVSSKTVETHLGHVYAKLDVPGRSDLASALSAPAPV